VHWPIALVPSSSDPSNGEPKKDSSGAPLVDEDLTKNPRPTWEAMEKLNKEGKAKAIGVSNWTIAGIKAMKEYAKILPAVNQVEIHPLLPNQKLLDYCESEGIKLAAYSPLGGQGADNPLFSDEKLGAVARDHGHTIVQVLIAWGLKRGHAVLAKSFTPSRIEENLKVVDLSEEEFKAVESAIGERRKRTCPYYASKAIDKKWLAEYWKRDEEEDA
jgi:diketogulonate reductase-like aldo/keto reductase